MHKGACLRWAIDTARDFLSRNTLSESTAYRWIRDFLAKAEVELNDKGEVYITKAPFSAYLRGGNVLSLFDTHKDLRDAAIV